MMLRRDVEAMASARGVLPRTVERDYLLDVCLHGISRLGSDLVFKGGTALFKFHGLDRFSEDLDFTVNGRRLDVARLQDGLVRVCGLLGIGVAGAAREVHQRAVNIELRLRGPLFDGRRPSVSRVVLDLSLKETPLTPDRLLLRSPYPDVPESALHVMSLPEMCAEKVRAVMTRDKSRDAYDLWYLLGRGVRFDEALVRRKLRLYGVPYTRPALVEALARKRARWRADLAPLLIGELPPFDEVMGSIGRALATLD